ncbi:MAG: 2,3-bisphosphoglycerate-independent phosphoglycerate mutase [Clostridia bacterium]|nr:2,3-bisphosphoglycerate-independent phosphoglycerate mutase [Clostridia bacterium]
MKTITVLLDGAGDRSYEVLGWQTPLQYARTPNLDRLAGESQCGLMTPYKLGCSLGTDLAHLLLFGYDMAEYPGRAVIDGLGEALTMSADCLILRASLADVKKSEGYFLNSRFSKDLSDEEIRVLCGNLKMKIGAYDFEFIHSYDSHGFIVVKGEGLSSAISDSDPFYNGQYVMAVEAFETDSERAHATAELVNAYLRKTYDVLNDHPINVRRKAAGKELGNMVLSKWAGMTRSVEDFYHRTGMKGLLIGQSKLLSGIAEYIDMAYHKYSDFESGVEEALCTDADYVHLHTKDPDTASHHKDPLEKVAALEAIDKMLTPLMDFEGLLIVTADHSTPCSGHMIHSGETVPFMARGTFIRRDDVSEFNEIACAKGSVTLSAGEFMYYIQNATDCGALYHLRAGRSWHNYRIREVHKL